MSQSPTSVPFCPRKSFWATLFLVAGALTAYAHDPGLSSANLELSSAGTELRLTFNERDLAAAAGLSTAELKRHAAETQRNLDHIAGGAVRLTFGGRAQTATSVTELVDANHNVEFQYHFAAPEMGGEIGFDSLLLPEMPFGHRQAFAASDANGTALTRKILSGRDHLVTFPFASNAAVPSGASARFLDFFLLGIRHILTGYDHLLFLFGLLIVCRGPRGALLLITCFTLAHSLTLALSTFDLVTLPSRWVEAMIAASILYVGIENLVRRDGALRGRWLLTFAFGLVHGLGFASVLHEMGVAKQGWSAVVPLVAFNSGVEVGQLTVAAIALPIIWKLRQRESFLRAGVPACSLLVAAAGGFWLFQRTFGA
ncbi:MAG: HupE/UreJ family protein [Chthoniobacterales bacterium]